MIRFEKATHTYWDGEDRVPGVSEILKGAGVVRKYYAKDTTARDRGTHIHEATELMDTLGLTPLDFPEELHPWLNAWEKFKEATGAKILLVETLLYNPVARYAGTMDRLLQIDGELFVADIKTGSAAAWHRTQVGAYAEALDNPKANQGMAIYLSPGKFKLQTWDEDKLSLAREQFLGYARAYHKKGIDTNE